MIHTDRAIVVEGKYDKIKLGGLIDGVILCTGGFRIYKDKEMQQMLRALAKKQGLAVLTDSDAAGFQIRSFLRSICGKENIVDVYIPDLYGKERRKQHPSREGKLGLYAPVPGGQGPHGLHHRGVRRTPPGGGRRPPAEQPQRTGRHAAGAIGGGTHGL